MMEVEDVLMQIRYTGCTWKIDVTHWFQIAFWSLDPTAGPAVSLKCTGAQTTFVIHHVGESMSHIRLYCLSGHFIKDDRQQEIKDNREVNSELCWHTCQSKTPVRAMCYIILVRSDSLLEPALGGTGTAGFGTSTSILQPSPQIPCFSFSCTTVVWPRNTSGQI